MRLLNVHSFEINSGIPDRQKAIPFWENTSHNDEKYAILSHRWQDDEVEFSNLPTIPKEQLRDPIPAADHAHTSNVAQNVRNYSSSIYKVSGACLQVRTRRPDIQYMWIDTICIDRRGEDGREQDIAINSMFHWYESAEVCYVYLTDVTWDNSDVANSTEQFIGSEWFTRGWTLQEMLAPKVIEFFDTEWTYIGSKDDLLTELAAATKIPRHYLKSHGSFRSASIAQKMSWLAGRQTRYVEDQAYCMLGIFDINMAPRYGHHEKEFIRLQEEIFSQWDHSVPFDELLFAWTAEGLRSSGILAPSPSCFRGAGGMVFDRHLAKMRGYKREQGILIGPSKVDLKVPIYHFIPPIMALATMGTVAFLEISLDLYQHYRSRRDVKLNCWTKGDNDEMRAVKLRMESPGCREEPWVRVNCHELILSKHLKLYPSGWITLRDHVPLVVEKASVRPRK